MLAAEVQGPLRQARLRHAVRHQVRGRGGRGGGPEVEAVQAQVQQQGAGAGGQGQRCPLPGGGRGEDGAVPPPGEVQEPPGRGHEPLPTVLLPAAVRARMSGQRALRVGLLPLRPGLPAALDPGEL